MTTDDSRRADQPNRLPPLQVETAETLTRLGIYWLVYDPRTKSPDHLGKGWQTKASATLEESPRALPAWGRDHRRLSPA